MNANQKVGYDVASAEELRREHEAIELQCWETYGAYAELLHKISIVAKNENENLVSQYKDLISQKEFMDFVCKGFALRYVNNNSIRMKSVIMSFIHLIYKVTISISECSITFGDFFAILLKLMKFALFRIRLVYVPKFKMISPTNKMRIGA